MDSQTWELKHCVLLQVLSIIFQKQKCKQLNLDPISNIYQMLMKKKRFFVNKIKQMQSLALLGICLSLPFKIWGLKRSGKEDIVALLMLNLANQLRTFDKLLIKTKLSSFTWKQKSNDLILTKTTKPNLGPILIYYVPTLDKQEYMTTTDIKHIHIFVRHLFSCNWLLHEESNLTKKRRSHFWHNLNLLLLFWASMNFQNPNCCTSTIFIQKNQVQRFKDLE